MNIDTSLTESDHTRHNNGPLVSRIRGLFHAITLNRRR